jgi:NADP-dependent 3-hydroxy acid dehydrogenase YdfG
MVLNLASGKVVVTGGSSGIGKSIVTKFFEAGFETVAADINDLNDLPGHFFQVDLTCPSQINTFIDDVKDAVGIPNILICNAGRGVHQKLAEGNPDIWEKIFQLNVFSALRLIRGFVPKMKKHEKNDVIFISSVSANYAHPYGSVYTATKAAVDQLAETLRLETQPDIRTTVIHPGVVNTNFFSNMIDGSQTPESIGWGALQPNQIADMVFYAVNRPQEIALSDIVMHPAAQPLISFIQTLN